MDMVEETRLLREEDFVQQARRMALSMPQHVGVLLLDSANRLVSSMLFPVYPDPPTLLAGLYASRTARAAITIMRQGTAQILPHDRAFAVRLLDGARFFELPLDVLVVTPSSHQALLRSTEPGQEPVLWKAPASWQAPTEQAEHRVQTMGRGRRKTSRPTEGPGEEGPE